MDRLDRKLLGSAYHDGAIDDHVGFVGVVDDFIDWAFEYHASLTRHQHYLMNHSAEIAGDEAHTETYYVFVGTDRDPTKPLIISGGRVHRPPGAKGPPVGHRRSSLLGRVAERSQLVAAAGGGRLSRYRPNGRPRRQ